ncbi:glycosyl hydrolase [Bimuria novae-zelandiae CBS 107.79]|uniref:Glycosyl hydrolase n=1 Tax=Bimuria novae-zelandiae CBS 107.79 TaxID=1447943 RepID=A0A6A5VSE4_9PLEO|nr:glycosyl hydrolase [Bimuria novae-zelandiae CBS 107.79]
MFNTCDFRSHGAADPLAHYTQSQETIAIQHTFLLHLSLQRTQSGKWPVEDYGLIGNMRTCALVATDGVNKDKGGHFSIGPAAGQLCTTKQHYLPTSNLLETRHLNEDGVMNVVNFFPRPNNKVNDAAYHGKVVHGKQRGEMCNTSDERPDLKKWLVRRVECMRGEADVELELFPAFNKHTTEIGGQDAIFRSEKLSLHLTATVDEGDSVGEQESPVVVFQKTPSTSHLGDGVTARFRLLEGQSVSFVLRDYDDQDPAVITTPTINEVQKETHKYWYRWISQSKYKGRWEDVVIRSLFILKLLTFEPTGAIVAAPTFSLPEDFGGKNDIVYSWVRDSSFTIYILLRMGFMHEAEAYTSFIFQQIAEAKAKKGALPIMFTIRGETDIPEIELMHFEGYRASKPLDIYGELMDGIYLANKFGKPTSYDQWLSVREITDYVCQIWKEKDMSIWEVRNQKQNFVYSKIMLWIAVDRALRLADKSCFPCPRRLEWLRVRDEIMEEVMDKGYNHELGAFIQSYGNKDMLDSAVLIAPLVFFVSPSDPRFLGTLDRILKPPEKGGLTSTGLVYRYNSTKSDDGVGGHEGAFSMCTFWLVEALTRAGTYESKYLPQAVTIFENILSFGNHLHMFSEEIARSGEQLGNTPQAFSHLALISAAFNLDRTLGGR